VEAHEGDITGGDVTRALDPGLDVVERAALYLTATKVC